MTQTFEQWRQGGIGSSDAPVVMKTGIYGKSPYKLWLQKIGREGSDFMNNAMKRGKDNEPRAIRWFEEKKNVILIREERFQHEKHPWMRATIDGIDIDRKHLVEIKTYSDMRKHEEIKRTRKVPQVHYPQLQHQIEVLGLAGSYFLSFNSNDPEDSVILECERDQAYIDTLLEEEEKFWDCVQFKIPPEVETSEYESMNIACAEKIDIIRDANGEIEKWEAVKEKTKEELIGLCGHKNSRGYGILLYESITKGRINYEQACQDYVNNLRAQHPEIDFKDISFEPYRNKSFTKWTLRDTVKK